MNIDDFEKRYVTHVVLDVSLTVKTPRTGCYIVAARQRLFANLFL